MAAWAEKRNGQWYACTKRGVMGPFDTEASALRVAERLAAKGW